MTSNFNILNITLPSSFSKKVQESIDNGKLGQEDNRRAFIRECVVYYESLVPFPIPEEYEAISKKICDTYPVLKNSNKTKYWVC